MAPSGSLFQAAAALCLLLMNAGSSAATHLRDVQERRMFLAEEAILDAPIPKAPQGEQDSQTVAPQEHLIQESNQGAISQGHHDHHHHQHHQHHQHQSGTVLDPLDPLTVPTPSDGVQGRPSPAAEPVGLQTETMVASTARLGPGGAGNKPQAREKHPRPTGTVGPSIIWPNVNGAPAVSPRTGHSTGPSTVPGIGPTILWPVVKKGNQNKTGTPSRTGAGGVPNGLPKGVPKRVPKGVPKKVPKGVPKRVPKATGLLDLPPFFGKAPLKPTAGFRALVNSIRQANANALACVGRVGCLGPRAELRLTEDVPLSSMLPPLHEGAYLRITGACRNALGKERSCYIDGMMKYPMFTSKNLTNIFGRLELRNLVFQEANGGVLHNLWSVVQADNCVFRHNFNGAAVSFQRAMAAPTSIFTNCNFVMNNGTALSAASATGRHTSDQLAFYVKDSVFKDNHGERANARQNGGAVLLRGFGLSVFENVQFINNVAWESGGAVAAELTSVVFKNCSFLRNQALRGHGAAVFGASGLKHRLKLKASFCGCQFHQNTAARSASGSSIKFVGPSSDFMHSTVAIAFCNTQIPRNTSFPSVGSFALVNMAGKNCANRICGNIQA